MAKTGYCPVSYMADFRYSLLTKDEKIYVSMNPSYTKDAFFSFFFF